MQVREAGRDKQNFCKIHINHGKFRKFQKKEEWKKQHLNDHEHGNKNTSRTDEPHN